MQCIIMQQFAKHGEGNKEGDEEKKNRMKNKSREREER